MELKQIKELMAAMKSGGIKKLSFKDSTGCELQLERNEEGRPVTSTPILSHIPREEEHLIRTPVHHSPVKAVAPGPVVEGNYVLSPMVGTYYSAASPDDAPFVKVGDRITEESIVCIIEAMKVMNEVKAGVAGVVAEVYVTSGGPVEFGMKLLRVT